MKPKQYSCSSGWASWSYLTTVEMSGCHNSGCDTLPVVYRVSISYVPAVYDGSNMEENAKPKMIQGASYQVQVDEVVNIQTQIQPGESE